MSDPSGGEVSLGDGSAAAGLIPGAIDCYTHANPDLLPRRTDDLGLARESALAGLGAVIHRHHYVSTAERSRLAADATGYPILGAVLLNESVGGLNPWAAELALEMGACWIGLPTLSAKSFRDASQVYAGSPYIRSLLFGRGGLTVFDSDGGLLPQVRDILTLVRDAGVALNLGYVATDEMLTVARAAAEIGHDKLVATNLRLTDEEWPQFLELPGFYVEVTCYGMHPEGLGGLRSDAIFEANRKLIRQVGPERVILSSDGGMSGAPSPAEMLSWGINRLHAEGFTLDELRLMVQMNPRHLVPNAPPVP